MAEQKKKRNKKTEQKKNGTEKTELKKWNKGLSAGLSSTFAKEWITETIELVKAGQYEFKLRNAFALSSH